MTMETKLKFKIGDKVRVKSLEWYNSNRNINKEIIAKEGRDFGVFTQFMCSYCGEVLMIDSVRNGYYTIMGIGWKWYDWMLEDEVVTEEKKVLQLKENDMKTKMTKEEAFDFLLGKKVLCLNQSETIRVQKKLFEIGYKWTGEDQEPIIDYFAIFIKKDELRMTTDINYWIGEESENIKPNEILAIQIKEEKPKFDPKTLQPFQQVLVRNDSDRWCARFYDIYEDGIFYTASGEIWDICIPYNEDTKHLHGTTENEPEFYRI